MTSDLRNIRSRLRETALEPAVGETPLRRLLDQHRDLVDWLTTPLGRRLYKGSRA